MTSTRGWSEGLRYDYGVTESLSVGGLLSYSNLTLKSDGAFSSSSKAKGLDNIELRVVGLHPLPNIPLFFRYGLESSLSVGRSITQANGDRNNRSGGQTFTPFLGAELAKDQWIGGVRLAYDVIKSNTKLEQKLPGGISTKTDLQGGNTFTGSVYGEMNSAPWLLGAALLFRDTAGMDLAGVDTEASPAGSQNLFLQLYAPYELTKSLTLLPGLQYGWSPSGTDGGFNLDTYHVWQFQFGVRVSI
ncbi:MAG: hypothetical protein H7222_06215 [Methylotenera sp.]|nr:hypothetical protein [Oligoflexia bacterium]